MEYTDHLREYMKGKAKRYVEDMNESSPPELFELKATNPERLIGLLEDGATPILRMLEDIALRASAMRATTMIRFSKAQAKAKVNNEI